MVLERGEVANTWRTERWDSLRLLTPNWQARLPGFAYDGDDPHGFMTVTETVDFIARYARFVNPPLHTFTTVTSVRPDRDGYEVVTNQGVVYARSVFLASGGFNLAKVPPIAAALPYTVRSITPLEYRRPSDLEDGGVLVVGVSATGIQLAEEIHRSGRPVTVSVGEHVRLPRVYRGHDIRYWMDVTEVSYERFDEVDDIVRARQVPSPQLVGTPERRTLDLNALTDQGVQMVGRLAGIRDGKTQFSGSLHNKVNRADLKMNRLLDTIDEWITERDLDGRYAPPHRFERTRVETSPPLELNLDKSDIRTVLWATGYRPDYSWMRLPVFDRKGRIRHHGGVVTDSPGLYVMGLNFLRRRNSSFISGAQADAYDLVKHLHSYLSTPAPRVPVGVR